MRNSFIPALLLSRSTALPTTTPLQARDNGVINGPKECGSNHGFGPQWPTLNNYYSAVDTVRKKTIPVDNPSVRRKPPFTASYTFKLTSDGANGKPPKPAVLINATFKIRAYGPLSQQSCQSTFGHGGNPTAPPWEQTMADTVCFCARPANKAVSTTGYPKTDDWWNTVEVVLGKPRKE